MSGLEKDLEKDLEQDVRKDLPGAGPAEASASPDQPAGDPSWMHGGDEEAAFEEAYGAVGAETPQASSPASPQAGQDDPASGEPGSNAPVSGATAGGGQASQAAADQADVSQNGQAAADQLPADPASADQAGQGAPEMPAPAGGEGHPRGDAEAGGAEPSLPALSESAPPAVSGGEDGGDGEPEDGEGGRMSLIDHLKELRRRLCWCVIAAAVGFCACWAVVEPIFDILTQPLLAVLPAGSSAMYTTLPEAFFTRMFIAFMTGLFVVSPFIFYQIWAFISPGLYAEEKRFIIPVALVSAVFFVGGGLFCYFIVFHYAFQFFVSFATEQIVAMPKISDYLDFVIKLILAFGFIFEMPIFSFFLSRMGVVTAKSMRGFRRYAVLLVFIVAAILTPPDVVSQLLMAVPMLLLYEVSILVAAVCGRKPKPEPAEGAEGAEGEDDGGEEDAGRA